MHPERNDHAGFTKASWWGLLKDGTWFAAFITLSMYALNGAEDRGQLRSDVKHLTDSRAEARKQLDAQQAENRQLNNSLRQVQIDLATKEVRLAEVEQRLAASREESSSAKSEAKTYQALAASSKRCKQYSDKVEHLESQLNISELDVSAPTGERRVETLEALKRSRDSLSACLSLKP